MSFMQFQMRRDTAANWVTANPTLLAGEWGFETDTLAIKLGDGSTVWNSLGYYSTKIRNGTTVPAGSLGVIGDFYIRTTTGDLYLKTAVSTWTLQISLVGPTGSTGPTGPAGPVSAFQAVGSTPNANAGSIVGSNIQMQPASAAFPGVMPASDKKKLNTFIYDVYNDYGGDPTGVADGLSALNNATAAAQSAGYSGGSGGIIWIGGGRLKTSGRWDITGHNIAVMGPGAGHSLDFGAYYTAMAAAIVPNGAFTAVRVSPVQTNGLNGNPNSGFKWKGVAIDGYSANATIGLQLISCVNFDIDDFYAINCTNVGLDFNTLPAAALTVASAAWPLSGATLTVNSTAASGTGSAFPANTNTGGTIIVKDGTGAPRVVTYTGGTATTFTGCSSAGVGSGSSPIGTACQILPGAQDTTRGRVGTCNLRTMESEGIGIQMNGDLGGFANTNLIQFVGPVKISHHNGIAIKDINSDTNHFDFLVINRSAGGTGIGVEIGAGSTNAFASRNNVFGSVSFGSGAIVCRGTPTNTFPSGPTIVMNYQLANGEALPTIEAGALLDVRNFNGCFRFGKLTAPSITTQALTAAALNQINNTKVPVPPQGFQVGTHLVFYVPQSKAAGGGLSWLYNLRYGNGTVGNGAIIQTVTYTATNVVDAGILEVHFIVGTLGSGTSGADVGYAIFSHDLAATGLATGATTPASDAAFASGKGYTRPTRAGFDTTLPASGTPQFLSLEINPVTAGSLHTVQPGVYVECKAQTQFN